MTQLIGRGRYARWVYPLSPGAAGAGAAFAPLTRQRFIDGGTVQPGLDGSAKDPFATIAQFMASRGNVSIADATANYVGWVTPKIGEYVEAVAFPAYATTELRADSLPIAGASGTTINGNVTWANIAGAFVASAALATLHNISVIGNITITDDAGAPANSNFVFSGDELGSSGPILTGTLTANTTTRLLAVLINNAAVVGAIDLGTAATSATLALFDATLSGAITAKEVNANVAVLSGGALTCSGVSTFVNCQFPVATVLTAPAVPTGAFMDGPSAASFVANGGTRAAGTTVLVDGGYSGAELKGAALTAAATTVTLNGVGADATHDLENSGNSYSTSNGVPTTVTIETGGGEKVGDTMLITKQDLGANVLEVVNGGPGAGTIGTIPTNARGFVLARFDGVDWTFAAGGSMLA